MKQSNENSKVPLPLLSDADMSACAERGECCQCGACCTMFSIRDIPKLGRDGPGSVRTILGRVQTATKRFGERCWHLLEDRNGRSLCALHGSRHKPAVCKEWRGDLLLYKATDDDDEDTLAIDKLRLNIFHALREAPNMEAVLELRRLQRIGALQSLILMYPLADVDQVRPFVQRWVVDMGVVDEGLFAIAGLPQILNQCSQEMLRAVINMMHPRHNVHQAFVRKYIAPLLVV